MDKLFAFLKAIEMEIYFGLISSKNIKFSSIVEMNEYEFDSHFTLPLYAKRRIWNGLVRLQEKNTRSRCRAQDLANMSHLEELATGMSSSVLD